ncbi:MAG: outer membrane lipoprotein-sorting protein [Rhodobacteraceae bacterium]|nr:MAG: outer membrane lipoprotein-sorting protein [Paracoccaceae bacterium]
MRHLTRSLAALILALCAALPARSETAAQKGLRIAQEASRGETGFRDFVVEGEMVLFSARGQTSTRRFGMRTVENADDSGSRSLLIFEWPGDIRNTALLTHSFDRTADDQWLYLPAVRKVRRISGSGRSGSFVGSEFAYEDMLDQNVSEFTYLWQRAEPCPNAPGPCDVVDRTPVGTSSYSVQRMWVDQRDGRVRVVQYFDRRGAHLKTLEISGYVRHEGRYWRPNRMMMTNHLTGKRTSLDWSGHRFNQGINATEFTPNALRNLR